MESKPDKTESADSPDIKQKQKTPKGLEIPIPTRREVEDALDKMAKSKKPSITRRRPKK